MAARSYRSWFLSGLIFRAARSWIGRKLVGAAFSYMSFAIPVRRLRETSTLLAFHHPAGSYPFHVLIVPKKPIGSLVELGEGDTQFMVELFKTVSNLVSEFNLEPGGYRLLANGGKYQDIPHLHFHLIAEEPSEISRNVLV
jgi:histidine triad (HIT) family protein